MKIGFIGIGVMGTGIINNLRKNNYDVTVYNRTKAHAQTVLDNGAKWANNPAELTKKVDILFSLWLAFQKMLKIFILVRMVS